ncbi:MAG: cation diffusion facilitator family transporter [Candidatus Margulisbacteria bacterium]|jgi:cobalt-zinc-cadmium efflux system protein|nr:cation diffusion facilitator family transporter [Candidatus Margulisiibacteriota bacterium]
MNNQRSLALALLIVLLIFFVELAGGIVSNSLALLSDAGHMLTDTMALALALLAALFAARPANKERTFGFYRLEILSALFNGSLLTLVALYIFYEAVIRFLNPVAVRSDILLLVATVGLLANIGAAVILARSSRDNLNVRGAFLHVISDLASSVAVIIGGLLIRYLGWYYVDPLLGILIGGMILRGALSLVLESVNILLEGTPRGLDLDELAAVIKQVAGVETLHDLHVWTITSGMNALSAHLVIADTQADRAPQILAEIRAKLNSEFHIQHSTFQTECESCPEGLICRVEPADREHEHHHHHH